MRPSGLAIAAGLGLAGRVLGHGDHGGGGHGSQKPMVGDNANWMEKHMAEEHHAAGFDAASFFALHDFNGDGDWEPQEILRTYGLMDDSNKHVSQQRKDEIVREILGLIDANHNGVVSRDEFVDFIDVRHQTLPDVGTGPGHHGDDEYEYEVCMVHAIQSVSPN